MNKPDQPRQVIHLHLLTEDEHYYFGSISAMYEQFDRFKLGVATQTLYNQWKDEPYRNDKVVIRKGRLIQKKQSKSEPSGNSESI
jgi:predicted HD phosphohydrolase